jgi:FkbM family methyltransferase
VLVVHMFERLAIAAKRGIPLHSDHLLWQIVRPPYRAVLARLARDGLERRINGQDVIRILPELYNLGETHEPDVWEALMGELRTGDVVLDIGAWIGLYTIAVAKRLGGAGTVVAFEPDPESARQLRQLVQLNKVGARVRVIGKAVGAERGVVSFVNGRGSTSQVSAQNRVDAITVESVILDDVFPTESVDIIKIDVEGYEQHVLLGGERLLSDSARAPRTIFLEVHPFAWAEFGVTSASLLSLLDRYGYAVSDMSGQPVSQIDHYGELVARRARSATVQG